METSDREEPEATLRERIAELERGHFSVAERVQVLEDRLATLAGVVG